MFLQSVQIWLQQPYPFTNSWRGACRGAVGTSLFVILFLFIFQPFGTKVAPGAEMRYLSICIMFGMVTAAITLFVNGLTRFFTKIFEEENWVVWKEITFNLLFIGFIGFGNLMLAHFLWKIPLNGKTFWNWQAITFAVGVFPSIIGALIGQINMSRKYTAEAAQMTPKPYHASLAQEDMLVLEGENQNETLRLYPSQIAYIAAADNYVRVFYFENGQTKNQMLRATMKKMEDAVSGRQHLFRCHRTYLINMDLVQKVSGNAQGYRLHLEGFEESIPVSRNLNAVVQKML